MTTTSTTITHVLALLLGATISYFIFRCPDVPTELPPIIDETAITIQVERRVRAKEVMPIKNRLKAAEAKLDSISKVKPPQRLQVSKVACSSPCLSLSHFPQYFGTRSD